MKNCQACKRLKSKIKDFLLLYFKIGTSFFYILVIYIYLLNNALFVYSILYLFIFSFYTFNLLNIVDHIVVLTLLSGLA